MAWNEAETLKDMCLVCHGEGGWFNDYSRELAEYFDWEECGECEGTGEVE